MPLLTSSPDWYHLSSTSTGGKDVSSDSQIRVIGSMEPEICAMMLRNLSEKLRAKFPATTTRTRLLHGNNCPSRWGFLRSFKTGSRKRHNVKRCFWSCTLFRKQLFPFIMVFLYFVFLPYAYLWFTLSISFTYLGYCENILHKNTSQCKFSLYLKKAGLPCSRIIAHLQKNHSTLCRFLLLYSPNVNWLYSERCSEAG